MITKINLKMKGEKSMDSSKENFLLIFHKPLDQIDGQTKYLKELIEIVSNDYNIIIPSEYFFSNYKWRYSNWLIRTSLVNIYIIIWIFKFRKDLKAHFSICMMEDRYCLIPALMATKFSKMKFLSKVSDWGIMYTRSLSRSGKISNFIILTIDLFYKNLVLRASCAVIVPSDYVYHLLEVEFKGKIFMFPHPYSQSLTNIHDGINESDFIDSSHDIYCVLIGNFNYAPNENSAYFIINDLAPKVKLKDRSIKFLLIGVGSKEKFSRFNTDNLLALGVIQNLSEIYKNCQIGINPSQTYGGTSIKNIEYLTNGLLVVSTREASEGVIKSSNMFIGERKEFLNMIISIAADIRDDKIKLSEMEVERIKKYYSKSEIKQKTLDFFKTLTHIN